jgi:hypothetical protein
MIVVARNKQFIELKLKEVYACLVQERGVVQSPEVTVVQAGRSGVIIFGIMTVLWVLALAVSESAQPTTSGRVAAGVVFGALIVLTVGGWFGLNGSRRRLEVSRDAIVSRRLGVKGKPFTLTRGEGDTLRILPRFKLLGAARAPRLMFLGRGGFIELPGFPLSAVRRACEAQGWRFDGDPALAVRDVQHWLKLGRSVEAAQLIGLFGPFPAAAADGEAHTSLEAAVFEDIGDKIARRARANAREAYRRAVTAQRAFAGCAPSPAEAAARMDEAGRIEGKARN